MNGIISPEIEQLGDQITQLLEGQPDPVVFATLIALLEFGTLVRMTDPRKKQLVADSLRRLADRVAPAGSIIH